MSRQSIFTATVATLLGATLGGLLFWRSLWVRRKRLTQSQTESDSTQRETTAAVEHEVDAVSSLLPSPSPSLIPVRPLLPSPEKLLEVLPMVVSSADQWEELWPSLEKELSVYPVLGLDCEWAKTQCVSVKGKSGMVSLLQMASYTGFCALVRLPLIHSVGQSLPNSLVKILNDTRVLKVGVGCYEDGKRLARDYGLSLGCTVDLRYLVIRQRQMGLSNGLSLKSLAADLLNVTLDKSLELRCSDWEADKLTLEQVTYAARDAQVSIALFFHLLGLNSSPNSRSDDIFSQLMSCCHGLVDVPFRGQGCEEGEEKSIDWERRRRSRRNTSDSSGSGSVSGDQQVPDPRKNRRKPLGVGYSARKSPLYDNCFLHAPDGQPLCTCDKKKAKWYLDKGIGELLSEDPFIVRLKFEPSGRPDSQQDYYLTAKENLCVVCGKMDSYIRKNIVPHEYRRHFPAEMKDHNSHDILLLCTSCHAASNVHDGMLKQQLAEEFGAPLGCEEGVRLLEDSDRRRVRSAARALLTASDSLPQARRKELEGLIKTFFGQDQQEVTSEMLQKAASLETRIFNQSYVPHGLKVVRAYAERGLRGLMELERRWRQHFLSAMKPRHLHPLWSVNHNHAKFLRKYGEDLPIQLN